jgi:uncharacterized membrane protein YidH (DUF202 family)
MIGELEDGSFVAVFVVAVAIGLVVLAAWRWAFQRRTSG